jgi:methyl-accepting chemotaxis protein
MAREPRPGPFRFGLALRLAAATIVVFTVVVGVLSYFATGQLEADLTKAFESKGEAVALTIATAAERSAKGDPLILQNAIESNRSLQDVSYVLVLDPNGVVTGSTFVGDVPTSLLGSNPLTPGRALNRENVNVARTSYRAPNGPTRNALDVAAPVARLTLGSVHVGMDRDAIDARVRGLQRSMLLAGVLLAIAVTAAMIAVVLLMVVRPVVELTRATDDIVVRGDLTQTIRARSSDEIGELASTFALMVDKLREIPKGIRSSTQIVASSVEHLSGSVVEQGKTATRQAAALQETQVTAQEIKQTSVLASQRAEGVLQHAERAEKISKTGGDAVEQTLSALLGIRQQVEEIAQRITRLGDRAVQIGKVTQTVKDLADQSNMLALNAAIEAVRSGEHGRGFAVVAREMRSLADQSIQGTKQVRAMLEDVGAAIREAVAITDKGVQRIDASLQQVGKSGQTLAELSGIVKDNSAAVRQISAAVGQQNAGIAQIFGAVSDQSKMMDDTITRLGQTEALLLALKTACSKLVALVEQFRV